MLAYQHLARSFIHFRCGFYLAAKRRRQCICFIGSIWIVYLATASRRVIHANAYHRTMVFVSFLIKRKFCVIITQLRRETAQAARRYIVTHHHAMLVSRQGFIQ